MRAWTLETPMMLVSRVIVRIPLLLSIVSVFILVRTWHTISLCLQWQCTYILQLLALLISSGGDYELLTKLAKMLILSQSILTWQPHPLALVNEETI